MGERVGVPEYCCYIAGSVNISLLKPRGTIKFTLTIESYHLGTYFADILQFLKREKAIPPFSCVKI